MHRSIISIAVLACAVAAQEATKDATAGGYYSPPAAAAPAPTGYGYQQQSPPVYQQPQPVYYQHVVQPAQYALPNYDVNYCTVHASFPLVDREHRDRKSHRRDRRSYDSYGAPAASQPSTGYGAAPVSYPQYSYPGHSRPHSRRFERQACRHTAIFSQLACDTCCKIASRGANTPASEITGALFVFDPEMSSDRRDRSESKEDDDEKDKDEHLGHKALQCVCCAPKRI